MPTGPRNLITDVPGLKVGNAHDGTLKSGATVLVGSGAFVASVDVMGGAPGTRETDLLAPDKLVDGVDALVLSGGSAFGLDAASGVTDMLARQGRGFRIGHAIVPIVPGAIIFDLLNGGNKNWTQNPYRALGEAAFLAADEEFLLGSVGAGAGALTATLKGGLGSASIVLANGVTVGALVVVNATGGATMGTSGQFWAAPFEMGGEYGGLGTFAGPVPFRDTLVTKRGPVSPVANTTIAIVGTDAILSKAQAKRFATAAQDGMARALNPSHTPLDGDLVFAVSTGVQPLADQAVDALHIGHAGAICLARAIARGVYSATPSPGDILPCWSERFGPDAG